MITKRNVYQGTNQKSDHRQRFATWDGTRQRQRLRRGGSERLGGGRTEKQTPLKTNEAAARDCTENLRAAVGARLSARVGGGDDRTRQRKKPCAGRRRAHAIGREREHGATRSGMWPVHWSEWAVYPVLHCHPQSPHTAFACAAKLAPDAAPLANCAAADQLPKASACGCRLVSGELPAAAAAALGNGSELDRKRRRQWRRWWLQEAAAGQWWELCSELSTTTISILLLLHISSVSNLSVTYNISFKLVSSTPHSYLIGSLVNIPLGNHSAR